MDLTSSDDSFVAQIHRLEDEKQQLEKKLQAARDTAENFREEKENHQSLLEKSTQQTAQWKSIAERYKDTAVAIDKLLRSLNTEVFYPDDSALVEDMPGE